MTTTITKNWISTDNDLFKARVKDGVEQIKVNGKWQKLTEHGRYLKTKTLYVTKVNHNSPTKKVFKEGRRYQVDIVAPQAQRAGYIYDEDGSAWQLYRDDIGFTTICQTYRFESKYS